MPGRTATEVITALHRVAEAWDGESNHPRYQPGTLYDCAACEAAHFCADGFQCVHCAIEA